MLPYLLIALLAFQDDPKFTSNSQLVIEIVSVKDKSGKPIEGLTAKDFVLTEDGKPQTITICEYQQLKQGAAPVAAPVDLADMRFQTRIAPAKPGDVKYKDRRLLALYFDQSAMPPPDQIRAFQAAGKFIRTQVTAADLVAVITFTGGAVKVLQDFSDDRVKLETVILKLAAGDGAGNSTDPNDAGSADTGSAFGQNDGEFNIFNTDRQLAALQTAVKMLGMLNEKKSLVYFASGLRLNGVDNQAQLQSTVNAAIRANVSFFPVDARGLVASAPMGDATQGSPGGTGMYTGTSARASGDNFQRSQDTLYSLAADTGGKALLDNNDLGRGIVQAQQAISNYYILGYYTTNTNLDGKLRKIRITVKDTNAAVTYRQGYYAGKEFTKFTSVDKERQLEDALMLGDPITELTIALELNYFQLNRAEYFVPLVVKIPGSELALARRRGAEHTLIDFIGEVKDEFGSTVSNVRDKVDIKLSNQTAAELSKHPVEYDTGFTLLPGNYTVKFLARDDETGRIGTYIAKFRVPNLNKEEKRLPISSVVLSSQRMPMADALYTAKQKTAAVNPLIQDGQKLIPSVTRVFSKGREMFVYLEAYERAATAMKPLVAFVTFYRDGAKAFETKALPVLEGLDLKSKAIPLRFNFPLDRLSPGKYDCQVTVIDPGSQKAAYSRTEVMVVQ